MWLSKKKRVFLVFSDLGLGGIQTRIISLVNQLATYQGVEPWIFAESSGRYSRSAQLTKKTRLLIPPEINLLRKRLLGGWRLILAMAMISLFLKPNSIFIFTYPLTKYSLIFFKMMNKQFMHKLMINDPTFPSINPLYPTSPKGKRQLASLYNQAKYVIAVSKSTYTDLKENFRIKSPPLIYLPNWTTFKGATTPKASGRNIDIVYGGRLAPQKRPLLMLKLFSQLLERNPNFSIHIYGDGETKNTVLNKINYSALKHHVHYHLPVQNFEPILKRSKILIFTSLYEGLPITGIEAMKCGVIVAGLDVPGVKDLIVRNKTGLLEKSVPKLAEQITKLLKNPKRLNQLRQNAYRYAKKHFSEKNEQRLIGMLIE